MATTDKHSACVSYVCWRDQNIAYCARKSIRRGGNSLDMYITQKGNVTFTMTFQCLRKNVCNGKGGEFLKLPARDTQAREIRANFQISRPWCSSATETAPIQKRSLQNQRIFQKPNRLSKFWEKHHAGRGRCSSRNAVWTNNMQRRKTVEAFYPWRSRRACKECSKNVLS